MPVEIKPVADKLWRQGYRVVHETSKKQGWQLGSSRRVWLKLKSKSGQSVLICHPDPPIRDLVDKAGCVECGADWYHSSHLKLFTKRQHRGEGVIAYGYALTFKGEAAVASFVKALRELS